MLFYKTLDMLRILQNAIKGITRVSDSTGCQHRAECLLVTGQCSSSRLSEVPAKPTSAVELFGTWCIRLGSTHWIALASNSASARRWKGAPTLAKYLHWIR